MLTERRVARVIRKARLSDYAWAALLVAAAALCRGVLEAFVPGVTTFVILLPAVVLAGVFCGTLPASVAAVAGAAAIASLYFSKTLKSGPLLSAAHVDVLLYLLACATVLWATHALRHAADAAATAEARLAEVFRQVPGAVAIIEAPAGRLLLRSAQSDAVLGHPQRRFDSSADMDYYGGLHADGTRFKSGDYPIVRALNTGELICGEHIRYRRPDGRIIDLEVHAGPVRSPAGGIVAAVGMAFDITKRASAERRLRDSEAEYRAVAERLRAAIDAGAFGLWEVDIATDRVQLDAGMAALLGMPPKQIELTRDELHGMIHPDDQPQTIAALRQAIESGGAVASECRMRTVHGAIRWIVSRGAVLRDEQKIIGVISDVTERREREEALQAALQARDVLMREADHRIKNSLQLVVSLLRLQLSRSGEPAIRHALGEAIARVDAVANTHLALQRSPDLSTIDVGGMLRDLCRRVGALNPAVTIRCNAASGITLDAETAIPLGLIASELLTNALRHAYPPGSPGEASLGIAMHAGRCDMIVGDFGVGMAELSRSAGLGSTVVAALARQIGAAVTIRSSHGKGTTVTVSVGEPVP